MNSLDIQIDPEFRALIPPLSQEERAQLEENIVRDGCRDPIVVWMGLLLDGHNRFEICQARGVAFNVVDQNCADRVEAKIWIIRNQFGRRNLQPYQRGELALVLKPLIAAKAKSNQQTRKGSQPGATPQKSAELSPIETRAEIAKAAGLSHDTIAKIEVIAEKAPAEIKDQLRRGETTINRAYQEIKRQERRERQPQNIDLPDGKFRIIYADPPWSYGSAGIIGDSDNYGRAERHYPSMTIAELCEMDVRSRAADHAVLFLWVTSPLLDECWPVIKAWGFEYKTSMVWDKVRHNYGSYVSVRHELLLICTRGSCLPDRPTPMPDSVITLERSGTHSQKPEAFRAVIDQLYVGGSDQKLELFGRDPVPGWTVYGNELAAGQLSETA